MYEQNEENLRSCQLALTSQSYGTRSLPCIPHDWDIFTFSLVSFMLYSDLTWFCIATVKGSIDIAEKGIKIASPTTLKVPSRPIASLLNLSLRLESGSNVIILQSLDFAQVATCCLALTRPCTMFFVISIEFLRILRTYTSIQSSQIFSYIS